MTGRQSHWIEWRLLSESDFCPHPSPRTFDNGWRHLYLSHLASTGYRLLVGRDQDITKYSTMHRTAPRPPQRMIWRKIYINSAVENLEIEDGD